MRWGALGPWGFCTQNPPSSCLAVQMPASPRIPEQVYLGTWARSAGLMRHRGRAQRLPRGQTPLEGNGGADYRLPNRGAMPGGTVEVDFITRRREDRVKSADSSGAPSSSGSAGDRGELLAV